MSNYSIGIDIGGTNTDLGLVREDGTVVGRERLATQEFTIVDKYLDAMVAAIRQLMTDYHVEHIQGIGIGAPNSNFYEGCIEAGTANLPIKERIPLKEMMEKRFNVPVVVDNDANASAYGELVYGGARGMRHSITITLGTGIGSGIVVDGKLVHGHTGNAGELGHSIIVPNGRPCSCGRSGCIETYASARGICQNYVEAAEEMGAPLSDEQRKSLTCQQVGMAAAQGDPIACKAYDTTAYYLGMALANAVNFSAPQAIFLMGGPTRAGEALMRPLRRYFNENLLFLYKDKVSLELSKLNDNNAAILGAAALCYLQS
ncbi:MAG: ROK family protein [Bacteroidales bacterium]|nr:ROK family protein [Bacteroidales bacterium]